MFLDRWGSSGRLSNFVSWKGLSRLWVQSRYRLCGEISQELGPESMIVCLSGRGDKDVVQVSTVWKQTQQRREKLMPKTLTENGTLSKQLEREFCPLYYGWDHEEGLSGLGETIHFLEDLGVLPLKWGVPFSDPAADGPVIEEAGRQFSSRKPYPGLLWRLLKQKSHLLSWPILTPPLRTVLRNLSEIPLIQ